MNDSARSDNSSVTEHESTDCSPFSNVSVLLEVGNGMFVVSFPLDSDLLLTSDCGVSPTFPLLSSFVPFSFFSLVFERGVSPTAPDAFSETSASEISLL